MKGHFYILGRRRERKEEEKSSSELNHYTIVHTCHTIKKIMMRASNVTLGDSVWK
jgi:hypothetical protein